MPAHQSNQAMSTPPATPKPDPSFNTLPPELRLQIYSTYLANLLAELPGEIKPFSNPHPMMTTRRLSRLEILHPSLLEVSHLLRNELYPLHARALRHAQEIIRAEKESLQTRIYEGRCFDWDDSSASGKGRGMGGFGSCGRGVNGAEVWAVLLHLGVRVEGLERLEAAVEKWLRGEESVV